jgi:hypothetical protein
MDVKQLAAAAIPTYPIIKGFRFRWLVYGAVAYYGIRYLNQRGILPKQTGFALGLFDRGIDLAKRQMGPGMNQNPSMMTH